MLLIKNAKINDAIHKKPYIGDILVRGKKITEIGKNLNYKCKVYDAKGKNVYPGFVEAHCHLGLDDYGGPGGAQHDYNESSAPVMSSAIIRSLSTAVLPLCFM